VKKPLSIQYILVVEKPLVQKKPLVTKEPLVGLVSKNIGLREEKNVGKDIKK